MIREFFTSDLNTGLKLVIVGLVVGVLGWFPLLLYGIVGSGDSAPAALGLIAMVGTLLGVCGIGVGWIWWVFSFVSRPRD